MESLRRLVNNEYARREWVQSQLEALPTGSLLLDAGCGSQQYREFCGHLDYRAQDIGTFTSDETESISAWKESYEYGPLDYTGNIWEIDEKDGTFDAILCTEVLEHIPYAERTIAEFSRLLKPNGILILTLPSNCLRHFDPYFFTSGYSDNYLELMLETYGFENRRIQPVGSYHAWLMVETFRSMRSFPLSAIFLLPAFCYHYLCQRNPKPSDVKSLCFGYHILATKASAG